MAAALDQSVYASLPPHELVAQRQVDPTPEAPLAYREYAYFVSEPDLALAERLVWAKLHDIFQSLRAQRSRKFVQLAVFDHKFADRPERAPIVVLVWKDWHDQPQLIFPSDPSRTSQWPFGKEGIPQVSLPPPARLGIGLPVEESPAAVAPVKPAAATAAPPAVSRSPVNRGEGGRAQPSVVEPRSQPIEGLPGGPQPVGVESPSGAAAGPPSTLPAVAVAGSPGAETGPMPASSVSSAAVGLPMLASLGAVAGPEAAPLPTVPPSNVTPATLVEPTVSGGPSPPFAPPSAHGERKAKARVPSSPALLAVSPAKPRDALFDWVSELFTTMHELSFCRDVTEGSEFVLQVLTQMLPVRYCFVHVFDINAGEFVMVRASGQGSSRVLLSRIADRDEWARRVMRKTLPSRMGPELSTQKRFKRLLHAPTFAIAIPVQQSGRYLGLLELVDPIDSQDFFDNEVNALSYIGERFAEFLADRPIVLDPDVLLPQP